MIKEENLSEINENLNTKFLSLLGKNLSTKLKNENEEILLEKTIEIDYEYNHILLETSFSFLNTIWNGNNAFIKINDHYYWLDQHNWAEEDQISEKKSLCNNIDLMNEKWTTPIRMIYRKSLKTKENKIKLSFGIKFHPSNNLSNIDMEHCNLRDLTSLNEIIHFSDLYISIK